MYALYDEERQSLFRLSAMLICGGLAVLPVTLPPSSVVAEAQAAPRYSRLSVPPVPGRLQFPMIAVEKDPFIADIPAFSNGAASLPALGGVHQGDDIGIVLPPNAGALGAPPSTAAIGVPLIRGVVLGEDPQALIDLGTGVKVYGIGDKVSGEKIRAIDATGVTLASGTVLKIVSAAP